MNEVSFSEWLRQRRKSYGYTQKQLAEKIGCAAITLRKIEAEQRRPSSQIIDRLAEIFQIPADELKAFQQFARRGWSAAPPIIKEDKSWLSSGDTWRSNLPAPLTTLLGRERELSALHGYLANDSIRLITLVGPPGVGKTRLSLEAPRGMQATFPDGIFFVALAPLTDPDLLASTILQTLGVSETKRLSQVERLAEALADQRLLLIWDNVEHLVEAVASLAADLLTACPMLKILLTSREALRITGEWLYPVPALELPSGTQLAAPDADTILQSAAVRLFVERARAVRFDFTQDRENLVAAALICEKLDGLPLAIELSAARMRWTSPQVLAQRLSDPAFLHLDGSRAKPARQKTLHNAISWSFDLLSAEEQWLLSHLSVFSGGFTTSAVEDTFSSASSPTPAATLIASLLEKSLLQTLTDTSEETRFSMLMTIQQFALERLQERGEETAARAQHLAYLQGLANRTNQSIHGSDQLKWIDRLEIEQDNFRAALTWCLAEHKTEPALHLLSAMFWLWLLRGNYSEIFLWFGKVRALPQTCAYPLDYARLLILAGRTEWLLDREKTAYALLEEARVLGLKSGSDGECILADALGYLGLVTHTSLENPTAARSLCEQSLSLHKKCGNRSGMAFNLMNLGWLDYKQDEDEAALRLCEQSLELYQQLGDHWGTARACQILGQLFLKLRQYDKARIYFEQHLEIDERLRFKQGMIVALANLGDLARLQKKYDQAEEFYHRSQTVCYDYGFRMNLDAVLYVAGLVALYRNDPVLARQRLIKSYHIGRQIRSQIDTGCLLIALAAWAADAGRPQRAARLSGAAPAYMAAGQGLLADQDRAELEERIQSARRRLGDAVFEAHAAEGRRMTLEQAIAEALEEPADGSVE